MPELYNGLPQSAAAYFFQPTLSSTFFYFNQCFREHLFASPGVKASLYFHFQVSRMRIIPIRQALEGIFCFDLSIYHTESIQSLIPLQSHNFTSLRYI